VLHKSITLAGLGFYELGGVNLRITLSGLSIQDVCEKLVPSLLSGRIH